MARSSGRWHLAVGTSAVVVACSAVAGAARQWAPIDSDADNPAIAYSATEPSDAVAGLQRAIDSGEMALRFDDKDGYLRSVLRALEVSTASQGLVFSRTSFQSDLISPARPRALYFNRDVYVGWIPGAPLLEIASIDARLGLIFYTLAQRETPRPRFERQTRACLACHDTPSATNGVPGLLVKSVHVDEHGQPVAAAGVYFTNDRSPMRERWGGWYVTGTHGIHPHLGVGIRSHVDTTAYLNAQSDLAALTALAHQGHVQNLLTRLHYRTRMALHFDRQRNLDIGLAPEYVPDTTRRIVESVGEPLVRAMLFVDEAPLQGLAAGNSAFAETFSQQAPRDRRGRSLFELDLTRRLLRYPCSYLIYSPAFDALPLPARQYVYRRLWEVLSGEDARPAFAHLTSSDRRAVVEILQDTKPEFATYVH